MCGKDLLPLFRLSLCLIVSFLKVIMSRKDHHQSGSGRMNTKPESRCYSIGMLCNKNPYAGWLCSSGELHVGLIGEAFPRGRDWAGNFLGTS